MGDGDATPDGGAKNPGGTTPGSGPLIARDAFVGLDRLTHLAAGGETPMLKSHMAAIERFMADKSDGMAGRGRLLDTATRVREKAARLTAMEPGDVSFLINASDGMILAASAFNANPGDNVVVAPADFPSVVLAAAGPRSRGIDIRWAGSGVAATSEDYAAVVDSRTRAIFVSHVSHLTGARQDLEALRAIADSVGARLIVDVSHALGPVPVDGSLCDILVCCCYKWLLAVHGCGLFCVNQRRWPELSPPGLGWHSVEEPDARLPLDGHRVKSGPDRFETGNPPLLAIHVLENGLDHLLAIPPETRFAHCAALGHRLRDGMIDLGLDVTTPAEAEFRAANICFAVDDAEGVEARLRERDIVVWGSEGRVRISPYLYNDAGDVDRCLAVLPEAL
ncbi:MAG: aminotransferase class V-fold PLP-dependent enzyme [Bauldia sp.]|nr:aminotransferase class V-fold PLP-dependent enzyme [Bauldia sp.]